MTFISKHRDSLKHIFKQFISYACVGGLATLVDWGSFWIFQKQLNWHYQVAVALAFTLGAITNYLLNKFITFRDKTAKVVQQIGVYIFISVISWLCSAGLMHLLIENLKLEAMLARMVTTCIMLILNFFMHKLITFNRRLYEKRDCAASNNHS